MQQVWKMNNGKNWNREGALNQKRKLAQIAVNRIKIKVFGVPEV